MLTPYFTIDQNDEYVFINVSVSHVRFSASAIEMVVDNEVFIFSLSPYYLRLRLPYALVDDERAHAEFDSKEGIVKIKVAKETKGQLFPDLDLTAKLLARKNVEPKKPLIEDLDVDKTEVSSGVEGEKHDWEIEQVEAKAEDPLTVTYGFNNAHSGVIGVSMSNGNDINELGNPEAAHGPDRVLERLIKENIKFDPEYYAADYIMEKYPSPDDDKSFVGILKWKSPATRMFANWYNKNQALPAEERAQVMPVEFSKEEQEKMLQLPRKNYLVDEAVKPQLYVLIISLLFAYQFDLRENEGEHNIESAWTVGKLVPQFAFLDSQIHIANESSKDTILKAAIIASIRRALSYPFHRNYKLVKAAWNDVYYTLRGGKRMVLKCLLDLKELFRYHDVYYVYDKIWLEDLCSWFIGDQVSETLIRTLAHDLKKEVDALQKSDITFEKIDDSQDGDEMIALDIGEVEVMAEDSFAAANGA
ncbi:uncharacterized protein CXQ87_000873 [Candidozyma duobushaemuli]|uniref:CS domain-containing protein n=2 Tax=Candidozyma TaxID=3303203 RepID=A0ABX8I246_9ASCO|nr:uncharacterized protein CXQ87_000873 [[Candida] duobushaemulonis]PVH17966.1 hypothetical protein CXQ87_000873 [[Candida] duobushaemulonis]QWU86545.1 hypothetical protein CA3LBN_000763 [[Candida] haemuloni]